MTDKRLHPILRYLRQALDTPGGVTDADLLQRFVARRDEAAFELLLRRHAGMVLRVCRQVLGNSETAEDAFQATFLVLVRKGASVRRCESLGGWLYRIAYRVALKARGRDRKQAASVGTLEEVAAPDSVGPAEREWRRLLHEEIERLPAKYRAVVVACYLESRTHEEAAQELGWPRGTVAGRLARARAMLRRRLERRGLVPAAAGTVLGALEAGPAPATGLEALIASVLRSSATFLAQGTTAGAVSARAAALAEGVMRAMFWIKVKIAAGLLLAGLVAGTGVFVLLGDRPAVAQSEAEEAEAAGGAPGGAARKLPESKEKLAHARSQSRLNLRKLAEAMIAYNDTNGHFPPPAIYGRERPGAGGGGGGMMHRAVAGGAAAGPERPGAGGGGGGMMPPGGGMPGGSGMPMAGGAGMMPPGNPFGGARPRMPGSGGAAPTGAPGLPGGRPQGSGKGPGMQGGAPGGMPGTGGMPGMQGGAPPGTGGLPGSVPVQGGKALLSWRVALLPYLGEQHLYKQFKLDEPWDGPHNRKLLDRMPKVYAAPGVEADRPYTTFYQVFVGGGAAFEKHEAMKMPAGFLDGTSNIILVVEAGHAVPWTKPEDLHYSPDEPLPELGGIFPDVFHAVFVDGAVHTLTKKYDETALRAAITRSAGDLFDWAKIEARPGQQGALAELEKANARARGELDAIRGEIQMLKEELAAQPDPRLEALQREQEALRQALAKARAELADLRARVRGRSRPVEKKAPIEKKE
jgi:RNA polymerase sigma factor (sigma-70 family)